MENTDLCLWHHFCCCPVLGSVNAELRGRAILLWSLTGEDPAGFPADIPQQLADIVLRREKMVCGTLVAIDRDGFGPVCGHLFTGIAKPEIAMKAKPCAEVAQIFQGIVIRSNQVTIGIPAMIEGSGQMVADVNFVLRYGDIDFVSLLKRLQYPVDAFCIAV
jgi:hypothetical protein